MFLKSSISAVTAIFLAVSGLEAAGADPVRYSTAIAPILRTYCVSCHSRVEAQNGLSLQAPDDILKGGENGLVLDSAAPANSKLLKVITGTGDDHMPPADEPQPSMEELAVLTQWIAEGATFDSRMAVLPALPKVIGTAGKVRLPALAMAVAADGQSIFAGRFRVVEQRSKQSGDIVWKFEVPDGKVNDVQLSGDGQRILSHKAEPSFRLKYRIPSVM